MGTSNLWRKLASDPRPSNGRAKTGPILVRLQAMPAGKSNSLARLRILHRAPIFHKSRSQSAHLSGNLAPTKPPNRTLSPTRANTRKASIAICAMTRGALPNPSVRATTRHGEPRACLRATRSHETWRAHTTSAAAGPSRITNLAQGKTSGRWLSRPPLVKDEQV